MAINLEYQGLNIGYVTWKHVGAVAVVVADVGAVAVVVVAVVVVVGLNVGYATWKLVRETFSPTTKHSSVYVHVYVYIYIYMYTYSYLFMCSCIPAATASTFNNNDIIINNKTCDLTATASSTTAVN